MEPVISREIQAQCSAYDISEDFGFLLRDPLTDLPEYYRDWMNIANNLSQLIQSHQLRDEVHRMPLLSLDFLNSQKELRLAHLALGFISMGYVWQEGERAPAQTLPKALAVPYWEVSRRLGLPAILTYADSVLANWRLRDPRGNMEIGNLDLIFSFPAGESCRGFFLVSLLVEMDASLGIMGILEVMQAMNHHDLFGIENGLHKVTQSVRKMKETFKLMHAHVNPAAFHGQLRIFVSGWRDNPMLPTGLLYEGVSDEPVFLSGGSAAQSTAIQCFDALLSIQHDDEKGAFLTRMRDYMPPEHRRLIEDLSALKPLRDIVCASSSNDLLQAYNTCVSALVDLRSYHLQAVTKYIIVPGNQARSSGNQGGGAGSALNETGTGGSNLMGFLRGVRDTANKALIPENPNLANEM